MRYSRSGSGSGSSPSDFPERLSAKKKSNLPVILPIIPIAIATADALLPVRASVL
jgi:hypothetical protein